MASVEDVESGANHGNPNEPDYNEDAELARIKGNYRTTVIVPELPGATMSLCFSLAIFVTSFVISDLS